MELPKDGLSEKGVEGTVGIKVYINRKYQTLLRGDNLGRFMITLPNQ
jgi:hypothetical protein